MENNIDTQEILEVKLINEIIEQNPPVIKKYKKHKEPKTTKICKICNIEKNLNEFVVNETLGLDRPIRMKNRCLLCYQKVSKNYYRDNKEKVLEFHKKLYESKKKKYSIVLKFNDITELTNEFNKLKDKLENNKMEEIKQRIYKKKSRDGGNAGGSPNSPVSETV